MRGLRAFLLTSSLATAFALSGCGGDDHDEGPKPGQAKPQICSGLCSPGKQGVASGPYVVEDATVGGTVTVLTDHGLDGPLDPAAASAPAAVSILSGLVTRSLTQYRYDPRTRQMVLSPDLAVDLGQHNDDYTKWIFTVREGTRFEDGSHVTARDVARGIRRCLHGGAFPTSPCLDTDRIRSIRVDQNQLLFHFATPYPDLPYLAAMPALGPVPPGTKPVYGAYAHHPLATGPYRIADYRRGHRLVLVRNAEWDAHTDPARTQYPDRYVVRAGVPERRIERLLLADQGEARKTLTLDTLDPTSFATSGAKDRLVLGSAPCTTYLSPDNRTITDPRVRRALIWAYPYRAALRAAGLVPGVTALPATNLVPPDVQGHTAIRLPHRAFRTSPRVARRMLAEAGALGTPLRFFYDATTSGRRVRDALVWSLRASGFDPRPARAPSMLFPEQTPANLPVDLRTTTRCGAWPSGEQWLDWAYRPTQPDRTGQLFDNTEAFSRPIVLREFQGVERLPLDQQGQAWNRLDRRVLHRWQPIVPLWYAGVAMAHGSRIEGMVDDTVRGMPAWSQIWVADAS
jgi:peptide/nickel transport system substrate-binding protein